MAPITKKPSQREQFTKFADKIPIKRAKPTKDKGAIPMTLEEYGAAEIAVEEALRGDSALLVKRLRTGRALPIEQAVAADVIDKKLRKPSHRPPNPGTSTKNWLLAFEVAGLMHAGESEKSAVSVVAEKANVSNDAVHKAMRQHPVLFEGIKSRT